MTTNETPYRPQVGDRVQVIACGCAAFEVIEVIYGGYTLNCSMGHCCLDELKLISRADGVPVIAYSTEAVSATLEDALIDCLHTLESLDDKSDRWVPGSDRKSVV